MANKKVLIVFGVLCASMFNVRAWQQDSITLPALSISELRHVRTSASVALMRDMHAINKAHICDGSCKDCRAPRAHVTRQPDLKSVIFAHACDGRCCHPTCLNTELYN